MKRILLAALLASAPIGAASAADLPVKALPRTIPLSGCGLYMGLGTSGVAGVVKDSPVPGASIVQGELGVNIGYTCTTGTAGGFWFVEGQANWVNANGATNGLSLSGPIDLFQRVGVGAPMITQFFSVIPGLGGLQPPGLPILPVGVTAGPAVPYLYAGVHEQDISAQFILGDGTTLGSNREWMVAPEIGIGMWTRLSNSVIADVYAGYKIQTTGVCLGFTSICPALGNSWTAGVRFDF